MVREVSDWDADQAERVSAWDLREVLLAYEAFLREQALVVYRHEQLLFVLGGTKDKKPPARPAILRDDDD
jgi:hypothetical protein